MGSKASSTPKQMQMESAQILYALCRAVLTCLSGKKRGGESCKERGEAALCSACVKVCVKSTLNLSGD